MMGSIVLYEGWYSVALCRARPRMVFVFGDNLKGKGTAGQAVIRREPNTFGVPTKRLPSMNEGAFFSDDNYQDSLSVLKALHEIERRLLGGERFVIPVNKQGDPSLGLERARLQDKAPQIYEGIKNRVQEWTYYFPVEEAHFLTL